MLKLRRPSLGKRLLIFEPPAAQAPPPPVRIIPSGHFADAQVLASPPASVQSLRPELTTSIQFRPPPLVAQVGGVPPWELLSVNTIDGKGVVGTTAGVPTNVRLFELASETLSPTTRCARRSAVHLHAHNNCRPGIEYGLVSATIAKDVELSLLPLVAQIGEIVVPGCRIEFAA